MLLTRLWLGLSVYSTWTSKYCQKFAYTYIYIYICTYIWKECTCASIHIHNFFVTNPRRKVNITVSLCVKLHISFWCPPWFTHLTPSLKQKTEAVLLHSRNESSKARFPRKELNACQFWLVPAGDEMRTSQCIEKILHCPCLYTSKDPHPHCICLGKGQAFRAQSRILKCLYSFQIQCWPCTNSAFKTG